MKKSKILAVLSLAVVLCFVCVTTSTFSWFARPQKQRAEKFGWDINYDISQGSGITMKTYSGTRDTYGVLSYPAETASFSATDLEGYGSKYFRTDIINSGTSAQSVSLYLTNATKSSSSGKFFLGVNGPTRTYKEYFNVAAAPTVKTASTVNKKHYYVGFATVNNYTASDYKLHWWNSATQGSGNSNFVALNKTASYTNNIVDIKDGSDSNTEYTTTYQMYYAEIPYDAKNVCVLNSNGNGMGDVSLSSNNTSLIFHYNNAHRHKAHNSGAPAALNTYYSTAETSFNSTDELILSASGARGGSGVSYSSSKTTVASVNSSSGLITRVGTGSANITVTATGVYGDKITATCALTVKASTAAATSISDVPIVTNLKIDRAVDASNPTKVSVYWYIKNDSPTALTYTVDNIYLTL